MSFSKRLLSGDAPAVVPGENFKVVTYTGNSASDNSGTTQTITGVGFKPDWVWIKRRDGTENHYLHDSSRGSTKTIYTNLNNAEYDETNSVTSFNSDGFVVGGYNGTNNNGETYVAWCWKAGGGTTSSNSDGSTTSTVQANKAAGFSIVTYTGTGSNASVGHGLGAPAKFIMIKKRSGASDWAAFTAIDNTKYLEPNGTPPFRTANVWQNTDPTSSVFTLTTGGDTNGGSATFVAYCFADVEGYQKFGSYDGNGSTNGPIVNVGFEPAFVMVKNLDSTEQWLILDNKRNTVNPRNNLLQMNLNAAESTEAGASMNFYSNGFQSVGTGGGGGSGQINSNGDKYLYWAIAATAAETPTLESSFNIETYTGTGAARSVTGFGFSPNFVWLKQRSDADNHTVFDTIRGVQNQLYPNLTNATGASSASLTSFDSNGFSLGTSTALNDSGEDYVAWTWKAGDFEPTINTNGSLTSFVSANANAGMSIVKWTGTGANANIGHGLSSTPNFIIMKSATSTGEWLTWHTNYSGGDKYIYLNSNNAVLTQSQFFNALPTSTVFKIGSHGDINANGETIIAYCFHDVTGYQKFGSYSGSGSDGNSITTGFKPDFVMVKRTNDSGGWLIFDTKRSDGNPVDDRLEANNSQAEQTNSNNKYITVSATGFAANNSDTELNASGSTYIYWAVAKNLPSNTTLASSFNAAFYAGSSTNGRTISTYGFKPDLVWNKALDDSGYSHFLTDSLRGGNKVIQSNSTGAETTRADNIVSFDSGGYTIDNDGTSNYYRTSYIAWGWKAGNQWQSNVNGTQGSLVNVNTANGFSIVKWKTNGSSSQTVGHGLSSTPELVIYKRLDSSQDWFVETDAIDDSYDYGNLNSTDAFTLNEAGAWSTRATSTTITNFTSSANFEYIAYCWHSVSGYSKIGSYEGNQTLNTDNVVNFGFKADFVMIKNVDEGSSQWMLLDTRRENGMALYANTDAVEADYTGDVTITSQGLRFGSTNINVNKASRTYLYMAFAKNATNNNTLANSFKVKTWTGNGTTQEITGIGFKPDLVWIKQSGGTNPHSFFDTTRGAGKMLVTSTDAVEINNVGDILGYFLDDGFQINRNHGVHSAYDNANYSGSSYVAWCWKAGNGWQSNTTGSISSLTNANTGNGFSIVKYKGTGSNATVGHGLSSAPTLVIAKRLNSAQNWLVGTSGIGFTKYLELNDTRAEDTASTPWNNTAPTSTVVNFGTSSLGNGSGDDYIMYCFHDVAGYSKFGTYTGNGSASGTVVEPGFSPDFVLVKRTDNTSNWGLFDSERSGSYYQKGLVANENYAEYAESNSNSACEFLAVGHSDAANGGFRFRDSDSPYNVSSGNYIYIAFKMN